MTPRRGESFSKNTPRWFEPDRYKNTDDEVEVLQSLILSIKLVGGLYYSPYK